VKFLLIVSLFVLFSLSVIIPQYSQADKSLVRTTFTREFNKEIIDNYLDSGNGRKIKAALLSIAQSEDTIWVPKVIEQNFDKYEREICFTLGQLGSCSQSSEFLLRQVINKRNTPEVMHDVFSAIGKAGDLDSFNRITRYYSERKLKYTIGISIAFYDYYTRNIAVTNKILPILVDELKKPGLEGREVFEAAFALYKITLPERFKGILSSELKMQFSKNNRTKYYRREAVPYLLGCSRKLSFFPEDNNLYKLLISNSDYSIKVAAAQTLIYYKFKTENELDSYLALLDDDNPNVVRAAAASLRNIKLDEGLKSYLKQVLEKKLTSPNPDIVNQDELFITYLKLFPDSFDNIRKIYQPLVSKDCFYNACAELDTSSAALDYLLSNYENETNKYKINILQSVLNFQGQFREDEKLIHIILGAINSDFPPLIAIAADGIDSSLTRQTGDILKAIIPLQLNKYKNDPNYQESVTSLVNLSKRVDKALYNSSLNSLVNSDDYPTRKFAYKLLGKPVIDLKKDAKHFNEFWEYAFKYKKAEVTTDNGVFIISLLPQYAPISAGNFSYLANKNFFNNNSFHRVVPAFVIQGGDPDETGWGGPEYDIVSEFSPLNYDAGMVGMASAGKDTEGSQWFVTTGNFPHLNGRYTIFGKIIQGMNIINHIEQNCKIISVKLI
jgi:cyclophilin family peptidyl-prolyl cis-trans isomerase